MSVISAVPFVGPRVCLFDDTGKIKGFFGGGSSSSSEEDGPTEPETAVRPEGSESADAPEQQPEAITPPQMKQDTIPLEVNVKFISLSPMTLDEKRDARQRYVAFSRKPRVP